MARDATRAIDALGLLTVVAYGSWFYGFGVLVEDISTDLGVGIGVLGAVYGLTTLVGGAVAVVVGRVLDRQGPRYILSVLGPAAASLYAASAFIDIAFLYCFTFALAGGLISASGFYSFTQPVVMSVRPDDPVRAVTRLTIWGAFASPIMIPLTEVMRDAWGWRGAVRATALALLACFFLAAMVVRAAPRARSTENVPFFTVLREATSSPFVRMYAVAAFMSSAAISTLLVFQVPVMRWAGLSAAAAASFAGARGLLQLFGRLPLVPVIEKVGAWRLQFACRAAMLAGAASLWASGVGWFAVLYVVIVGTSTGALAAIDGIVAREVLAKENLATVLSVVGLVGTVGGALGPVSVGLLVQTTGSLGVVPLLVMGAAVASSIVHVRAGRLRAPTREI